MTGPRSADAIAESINYLQRDWPAPPLPKAEESPAIIVRPEMRALWRIRGVGRIEKSFPVRAPLSGNPHDEQAHDSPPRSPAVDLMTGLYGSQISFAFLMSGTPAGVAYHAGAFTLNANNPAPIVTTKMNVLSSV